MAGRAFLSEVLLLLAGAWQIGTARASLRFLRQIQFLHSPPTCFGLKKKKKKKTAGLVPMNFHDFASLLMMMLN